MSTLKIKLFAGVAALMIVAPSCVGHHGAGGGELRASKVVGAVTIQPPGQNALPLSEGSTVPAGSALRTGDGALVRLEDGSGKAVELAGNTQATIISSTNVSLDLGSALGESGSGSLDFDSRGIGVHVSGGAARLERLLGVLHVGVYSGSARVDLLARSMDVPAYREADFAGGIPVDRAPRPLTLKDGDPWDVRLMGDVLEFDRNVSQFGRGFNAQFAGQAIAPAFFGPFVPVVNVSFVSGFVNQEPAEVLIGLVLSNRLAQRTGAPVARLFQVMLAERQQGATWGLIAKERGLELQPLLAAVLDAIRRGTAPSTPGGSAGAGGGGGGPGQSPGPRPSGSPKPKPKPSPTSNPTTPPTPPPCGTLDRLLGLCPPGSTASSGGTTAGGNTSNCSIVGVLIDPKC